MKTLEELIVNLEIYFRKDDKFNFPLFTVLASEMRELIPGLKQAQSERQQVRELDGSVFVPGVTPPTFTTTPPSLTEAKRYPENTYDNFVLYEDYKKQGKELEVARAEIAKEKEQKLKWASKVGGYVIEIERLTQAYRDALGLKAPTKSVAVRNEVK